MTVSVVDVCHGEHRKVAVSAAQVKDWVDAYHERQAVIVFTNGVFDLFHAGHVELLEGARSLGTVVVVSIPCDSGVRATKGAGRPIFTQEERVIVVSALSSVDLVIPYEGSCLLELVQLVRPTILLKGSDYRGRAIVGSEYVVERGGRIEYVDRTTSISTSEVLERCRSAMIGSRESNE